MPWQWQPAVGPWGTEWTCFQMGLDVHALPRCVSALTKDGWSWHASLTRPQDGQPESQGQSFQVLVFLKAKCLGPTPIARQLSMFYVAEVLRLASSLLRRQHRSFENDFLSWLAFMFIHKPVMFELWFKAKNWNNCHYLHTLHVNQKVTAVGNTTILKRKHLGIH